DVAKTALLDGLRWLEQESQGGENSILYFSGHGASSGHLLLVDFAHGREADAALSAQELTFWIRQLHSERTLIVLDACHAGMAKLKDGAAERKGAPDGFDLKAIEAVMGQGRAIFAASQPAQPSVILTDARNSLFTGYLIDGLDGAANKHIGRRVEDAIGVLGLAAFLGDQNYHGLQRPLFKVEVDRNFEVVPAKHRPPGLRPGPAGAGAVPLQGDRLQPHLHRAAESLRIHSTARRSGPMALDFSFSFEPGESPEALLAESRQAVGVGKAKLGDGQPQTRDSGKTEAERAADALLEDLQRNNAQFAAAQPVLQPLTAERFAAQGLTMGPDVAQLASTHRLYWLRIPYVLQAKADHRFERIELVIELNPGAAAADRPKIEAALPMSEFSNLAEAVVDFKL